jgi:hypothetical protein
MEIAANFAHALAHAGQPDTCHAAPVSGAFEHFLRHAFALIAYLEHNIRGLGL